MPKFHNKDGSLTRYSFACGYIEVADVGQFALNMSQDGCWHVKAFNHASGAPVFRLFWETFDTMTAARKFYRKQVTAAKRKQGVFKV